MEQERRVTLEELIGANVKELRVSNGTQVKGLATAVLRYFEEGFRVSLSCIGAQSQSQALKAIAAAQGELASQGKILVVIPAFDSKIFADKDSGRDVEMTAIKLIVGRIPLIL